MAVLVYITAPHEDEARTLARELVEQRLAAGANVAGSIRSFYRWQGEVREAGEWQIFVQARRADFESIKKFISARHSHETPCVLALDIEAGHGPFLQWIANKGEIPCAPPSSPCRQ